MAVFKMFAFPNRQITHAAANTRGAKQQQRRLQRALLTLTNVWFLLLLKLLTAPKLTLAGSRPPETNV